MIREKSERPRDSRGAALIEHSVLLAMIGIFVILALGGVSARILNTGCAVLEGFGASYPQLTPVDDQWICWFEGEDGPEVLFAGTRIQ